MVKQKQTAPFGSWSSPVSASMLASRSLSLAEPTLFNGNIYWLETRPAEQGRSVVVEYRQGVERELSPADHSVRSSVHEYGGGAWTVGEGGLFYVNGADQRLYRSSLEPGSRPGEFFARTSCRYADLQWDAANGLLLAIEEEHPTDCEPVNRLVALVPHSGRVQRQVLAENADFYASARVSASGSQICWLQWNHPCMPWFGCELWQADFARGALKNPIRIAGSRDESIFQPGWIDEQLYFCSDRNLGWQLFRQRENGVEQVSRFDGECGLPQWQFGMRTWCQDGDMLLCAVSEQASWRLYRLDPQSGDTQPVILDASLVSGLDSDGERILILGSSATRPPQIQCLDAAGSSTIRSSTSLPLDDEDISRPQPISVPTNGGNCHAFFYPPRNRHFEAPENELPPLIVICHGGPTAATAPALNLKVQFWTSRGFAVADVNYRGSTGYGRQYRESLDGKWGIADVEDACNTARFLAEQGKVDAKRLLIRGSSAGGLTVLSALTFHQVFAAGASVYGIGDLKILAAETHKFEARYGDRLIAPWPGDAETYAQRSPINHIDQLVSPVIFFQGLQDRVVPPNQAEMMFQALCDKGVATALRTYQQEGHGFRSEQAIVDSLNAELAFYGAVLGFTTDSSVNDLEIVNL